jgi:toxin ParE1/3/4
VKPVHYRDLALDDIDSSTDYYATVDGKVARQWVEELQRAVADIGRHPRLGSSRFAEQLGIEGLRHRTLGKFPYLVFYIESDDRIVIVRVLHERRDVDGVLRDSGSDFSD